MGGVTQEFDFFLNLASGYLAPLARLLRESPNCISESQRVVQEGPYKSVRHPGYLGVILLWVGAGLATVNWIVAALVTLTIIAAYRYRINAEERMLVASFGEQYAAYAKHTWRLLPFVW